MDAVTVASKRTPIGVVLMVNVTLFWPAGTVTDGGTFWELVAKRLTIWPCCGAGCRSVSVAVVDCPDFTGLGLNTRLEIGTVADEANEPVTPRPNCPEKVAVT